MRFLLASFLKDLHRWRTDASAILIWLVIPLMIGGLLSAISSGGSAGPSGTLLIADEDDSLLSGLVSSAFSQDQLGDMLRVREVSIAEGKELIDAGEASGFLTIPEGFQAAFLNETPVTLTLKTNPAQTILPGIIEDVTEIVLDLGFYLQALFGEEIASIQNADEIDAPAEVLTSDIAVQVQRKMDALGPSLFPPLFDVTVVEPPPTEPKVNLRLLFLPGIVMMALLFTAQGLATDLWAERSSGTLRRLVSTSGSVMQFVVGKSLAAGVVILLIAGITMLLGFLINDVSWRAFVPSLLWVALAGIGFFVWFAALQMFFPSQKSASLITGVMLFPLLMMGGSFFPLDALPDWLAAIGRMSPNGFVVDRMTTALTSAQTWSYSAESWLIVAAMVASGFVVCSWRLSSGFARRS